MHAYMVISHDEPWPPTGERTGATCSSVDQPGNKNKNEINLHTCEVSWCPRVPWKTCGFTDGFLRSRSQLLNETSVKGEQ
eukprot:913704-Amphidinium_carterae.3